MPPGEQRTEAPPPGWRDRLMEIGDVAEAFGVSVTTVTRWTGNGKLSTVRTLGVHRPYWESEVRAPLKEDPQEYGARGAQCHRRDPAPITRCPVRPSTPDNRGRGGTRQRPAAASTRIRSIPKGGPQ
jgi:hypothetical protein